MGKFTLRMTPYQRRDPVTGVVGSYVRNAESRQSSPELKKFQACVAKGMRGVHATGATAGERARSIRNRFSQVASNCK